MCGMGVCGMGVCVAETAGCVPGRTRPHLASQLGTLTASPAGREVLVIRMLVRMHGEW